MRISRLELIRYGKFTGLTLQLPYAERDFHVIVGPNEAGKSTIREAINDLLFGIPRTTPHAFLHPMPELRLGASIAHDGRTLDFERIKANRQTLRGLGDAPLADGELAEFLGSVEREFFTQIFGLDHDRLVKGGQSILTASNDLGQILFQSAAGITALGTVRDGLTAEADGLWSARRAGGKAYYIASDELDRATAVLKDSTVRTRVWTDAETSVNEHRSAWELVRQEHATVVARRMQLERIRRVAPHLRVLEEVTFEMDEFFEVVELPENAASLVLEAEREISAAQVDINHQTRVVASAEDALRSMHVDGPILAAVADIERQYALHLQYGDYEAALARRQAEIDVHNAEAGRLAERLGWKAIDERGMRTRLPSQHARDAFSRLMAAQAGLRQAAASSERTVNAKRAEAEAARLELDRLGETAETTALQAALVVAQKLGDVDALQAARLVAIRKHEAAVDAALNSLGAWRVDLDVLGRTVVPDAEVIAGFTREAVGEGVQRNALAERKRALEQQQVRARAELERYRLIHQPVARDDVLNARRVRNRTWEMITAQPMSIGDQRAVFEHQLLDADVLADKRHDTAEESGEALSRQVQLDRVGEELFALDANVAALDVLTASRTARWTNLVGSMGLIGLPSELATSWIDSRHRALVSADSLRVEREALEAVEVAVAEAIEGLAIELKKLGRQALGLNLAGLTRAADEVIVASAEALGQRRSLERQLAAAQIALAPLLTEQRAADDALSTWSAQWDEASQLFGLSVEMAPADVADWLDSTARIAEALREIGKIRIERIDKMRADLREHDVACQTLAGRIAHDLGGKPAADIATTLYARLEASRASMKEATRERGTLMEASRRRIAATESLEKALSLLAPLLQRAGVNNNNDLLAAIRKSDRLRGLQADRAAAEAALRLGSDGLALEALMQEAAQIDAALVPAELTRIADEEAQLVQRQTELATRQQAAQSALDAIGGVSDAARAEGDRQQALAQMAEAVERFIKVHTASRLLGWSIERYREAKQGPMLTAASAIFARLTIGSFGGLTVDFEVEPPQLIGRRPNGATVAIERMSEGTRDQLFLALRLAVLDMHVGQTPALPFIADDLYVNYDDQRAEAGLVALGELSRKMQVIFLTHHDHLLPAIRRVFGEQINVMDLH